MSDIHRLLGFAVVGVFTVGWVWGLGAWLAKRGPGEGYWVWLTVAQLVAGAQAILGIVMYVLGRRLVAEGSLGGLLHYVYGLLPILLLVIAHVIARAGNASMVGFDEAKQVRPWVPFAWAAFISFGLTSRALLTGLGVG